MTDDDIPAGMRLREAAGWNQTREDWRRFLAWEPRGCFVAADNGRVCGTVTTVNYEQRFGWIGMLLVAPGKRGLGIGTALLRKAMDSLREQRVETIKLDATPMGHPLYLKLGFVDEYPIERWEGISRGEATEELPEMSAEDLASACRRDRAVFGADRSRLLECLWREGPRYCSGSGSGSGFDNYIFGRSGAKAHYLGPWVVASQSQAAERLFLGILSRFPNERFFIDLCNGHRAARRVLEALGFKYQRSLMRMYCGSNRHPGAPQLICGIAGPEIG